MLPFCGDDVIDDERGEACDDGDANSVNAPCLPTTCQVATCGDSNLCSDGSCTSGPGGGIEQPGGACG